MAPASRSARSPRSTAGTSLVAAATAATALRAGRPSRKRPSHASDHASSEPPDPAAAFWHTYLARHPLTRPASVPAPSLPLVTPDELFRLLVAAADAIRGGRPRDLRIYLGDARMMSRHLPEQHGADYGALLPRAADRTLAGYGARLRQRHGYPCFAIMLNDCQVLDPALWFRVRDFVRPLIAELGFPAGGVDANIFAGNYRRTPFGVHTDDRDVFTWIAQGPKRFLVWPYRALAGVLGPAASSPRHPLDYEDLRARATTLAGRAGELLYWPKDYWHVAEARPGELSATLSIGLDHRLPAHDWVRDALADALDERRVEPILPRDAFGPPGPALVRTLPARLAQAVAPLGRRAAAVAVERELRLRWLAWVTGLGLRAPPRAAVEPLRPDDTLVRDPRDPIAWYPWRGHLLCAANGHALAMPASPALRAALRALDAATAVRVRALAGPTSRGPVAALLSHLVSFRALRRATLPLSA